MLRNAAVLWFSFLHYLQLYSKVLILLLQLHHDIHMPSLCPLIWTGPLIFFQLFDKLTATTSTELSKLRHVTGGLCIHIFQGMQMIFHQSQTPQHCAWVPQVHLPPADSQLLHSPSPLGFEGVVLMSNLGQKRPVKGEDRGLLHIASSYPSRWKMGILLPNYMNVLHAATVLVPYYYPWLRCDIVYPLLQRCGNNSSYQSTSHSRRLKNSQPSSDFAQAWLRRPEEPECFQIERRVIIMLPILCCLQLHHTVH